MVIDIIFLIVYLLIGLFLGCAYLYDNNGAINGFDLFISFCFVFAWLLIVVLVYIFESDERPTR